MDRVFKQAIIAMAFVLLIGGVSFGIYQLVRVKPTCTDNIQNQGELGIDCGPVCGNLCAPEILSLQVETTTLLSAGDGKYDAVTRVDNPNISYGSSQVQYALVLQDGTGAELGRYPGSFYIGPGRNRMVVQSLSGVSGEPAQARLVISDVQWQKVNVSETLPVEFSVRREAFTSPNRAGVAHRYEGVLFNDSDFDFARVDIVVLLSDDAGTVVGIGKTNINTFLSKTERYFSIQWSKRISQKIADIRVEALTNLFENENFIKRYGTQEEFQKYYPE